MENVKVSYDFIVSKVKYNREKNLITNVRELVPYIMQLTEEDSAKFKEYLLNLEKENV